MKNLVQYAKKCLNYIELSVRYLCMSSLFPDDNAGNFVNFASLSISLCSFSSLILSSIAMISFYILSKRFFLKCKGLSEARIPPITKKEYGFVVHFL